MAPNGARLMEEKGIEHSYIPHSVDTKVIKPTHQLANGMDIQDYFKSKDKFVVGMVAANKASGMVHRKAFSENLLAFKLFQRDHPDAVLYIHTDPSGLAHGWNLMQLLDSCGLDRDTVMFPNPLDYRFGVDPKHLAALYTGMDVLLAPSYGEGFGVPTIEAQACGTRVIGSSWAATPDLVSDDCWLVEGQPQWDSAQNAWWQIPKVDSIVAALKLAYAEGKTESQKSIEFAKAFDVHNVWNNHWLPVLNKLLPQK
jgi:glycosyltransferase involved in cell wall biosynthesis